MILTAIQLTGVVKKTQKGLVLEELINKCNFNIINNNKPTYICLNTGTESVIELAFISNDLSDRFNFFKVYSSDLSSDLTSDHFPIKASFALPIKLDKSKQKINKIKRTDWKNTK